MNSLYNQMTKLIGQMTISQKQNFCRLVSLRVFSFAPNIAEKYSAADNAYAASLEVITSKKTKHRMDATTIGWLLKTETETETAKREWRIDQHTATILIDTIEARISDLGTESLFDNEEQELMEQIAIAEDILGDAQ